MKSIIIWQILLSFFCASCAVKVPLTEEVIERYNLSNESVLKKIQYYTSSTIILERSESSSEALLLDRVIIPANTKCVLDKLDSYGNFIVRFESGEGGTLNFNSRKDSKRKYIVADWNDKYGIVYYQNKKYAVTLNSIDCYLMLKLK